MLRLTMTSRRFAVTGTLYDGDCAHRPGRRERGTPAPASAPVQLRAFEYANANKMLV